MVDKDKIVEDKIDKVKDIMRKRGIGCGKKIAEIARSLHPNALFILPLYRSCIVVEQDETDQKEGDCKIFAYADPHWLGGEIDIETLKSGEFDKFYYNVQGDRQGPEIIKMEKLR